MMIVYSEVVVVWVGLWRTPSQEEDLVCTTVKEYLLFPLHTQQ